MESKQRQRQPRVTVHSVAAAAGVSKSTVSRILDERLPRSDSETAMRVRKIAAELGYVRDVSAASLRRGNTMTIGVIVPRLTDTVMAMLYEAIVKACARTGRFAIVATTEDRPEADRLAAESLINRGVDGLILSTARNDDNFPDELMQRGIPYVLALRTDHHSLSAIGDDRLGGYLAARHLLDLGHRRIGVIAGPSYASSAIARVEGYRQALEEASIPLDTGLIVPSTFGIQSGAEAVEKLMALGVRPTAIFAVNDNTAIGALSALNKIGLSVPDDVSLVGYNDIPIVSHLSTPLTTLRVPFDQIASNALDLLTYTTAPRDNRILVSAPTLIPRKSTARHHI
ncbi:substrate-binding domain-containing protein [Agrobacterium tumefaciens]|uniref:LacI family DNA-binding transcriptional regulator n=1 Tax=Agrobacterium tumefaciens TaxID=358 RepID=UPI001571C465|nr:LacI family DNA-binding transcriptional regulator [Agrobacterium tumefaciens]NTE56616.1 substrate-binding domain-containing protein [Agrobacterium tumefaciens]NTE74585.1 substrate-binding domain-containing protein [Agrobacterium tumefaciens]